MRIVLDTNVIISAFLIFNSKAQQAYIKALKNAQILYSIDTLNEIFDVIKREKFNKYLPLKDRIKLLIQFIDISEEIQITANIEECRDIKDNKILELAESGNADLIITGDNDLLVLNGKFRFSIMTLDEFFEKY